MRFAPSSYKIFFIQIFCTVCSIITFLFFDWKYILLCLLMYSIYACLGVALCFHRTLAHKAWEFPTLTKKTLTIIGSLANVGSPLTWVALHREHHRFSDTDKDPSSPTHKGFWHVMYGTMFDKPSLKYAPEFLRDDFYNFLHKNYYLIQIPVIILFYIVGGVQAVIAGHFASGGLTWISSSFVNYFNHKTFGYRNFDTRDSSSNNIITGYLIFGEGWHNNHHYNPGEASTKKKWWEFDITSFFGNFLGKPIIKENKNERVH